MLLAFRTATVRSKTSTKIGRDFLEEPTGSTGILDFHHFSSKQRCYSFFMPVDMSENEQTEWRRTNYMLKLGPVEFIES